MCLQISCALGKALAGVTCVCEAANLFLRLLNCSCKETLLPDLVSAVQIWGYITVFSVGRMISCEIRLFAGLSVYSLCCRGFTVGAALDPLLHDCLLSPGLKCSCSRLSAY